MNKDNTEVVVKLTADQIDHIEEICNDIFSIDKTLDRAMQYHGNKTNELEKAKNKWWENMELTHGLDLGKYRYTTKRVDGATAVVCVGEI